MFCPSCKTEIQEERVRQGRKFCGPKCYWRFLKDTGALRGRNNPSWKADPIIIKCVVCGADRMIPVALFKKQGGKFCSFKCAGKHRRKLFLLGFRRRRSGAFIECTICGQSFWCQTCDLKKGIKKYCSRRCLNKANSLLRSGPNHPNWKGGAREQNVLIRESPAYEQWRRAVFTRDAFTCQECGQVGGRLSAHHIKPFSNHPHLRLFVPNGITLCWDCHKNIKGKESCFAEAYSRRITNLL